MPALLTTRNLARLTVCLCLLLLAGASAAAAQVPHPMGVHLDWRTVETDRFTVHYPRDAEAWTLPIVSRIEAMGDEVAQAVGFAPERRVTVVVADPFNLSDGYAAPFMGRPITVLWATPPEPRTFLPQHSGWGETLFVHEFAHLAHMTVPARNPLDRFLYGLIPVRLGPITFRSPRWVVEGYATYLEGRLTGLGRPHDASRPAFLRVRALEGRLPTYGGLSGGPGYLDLADAYMVGSAYLEWLVDERGDDESLNHLWRRMSARQRRSFDDAFRGVFGAPPAELYGRYAAELVGRALAVRDTLEAAGLEEGELFQLRRWSTGDPAISPDGELMAIELGTRGAPSRLVVWRLADDPDAAARAEERRQRQLERDPLDVPAVEWRPTPKQAVATLHPAGGRAHRHPRFMPDGERILVVRWEPTADGSLRPDLFLWDFEAGSVRRVTRGAGIRIADPSPDGAHAAGVRCVWGVCDLVRIDLATGAVTVLAAGSPDVVYYRPRYSPDGRTVVVSVQEAGRWRLVAVPADVATVAADDGTAGAARRYLDPDDGASRYDAAFLPGGDALVTVSTLGGVPNLERLDLATGEVRPVTRVVGAAAAPDPSVADGYVYFLGMHSRGWDVRRVAPDDVELGDVVHLPAALWPAAPYAPAEPPAPFTRTPVPPAKPYGLGPQRATLLPAGSYGADRGSAMLTLTVGDPVGRTSVVLAGAYGSPATWQGAGIRAAIRRFPADVGADAFFARQHPSGQRRATGELDADYAGGAVSLGVLRDRGAVVHAARAGASAGRLDGPGLDAAGDAVTRAFAFAEARGAYRQRRVRLVAEQAFSMHGAAGRTGGESWRRGVATARLGVRAGALGVEVGALYGHAAPGAPSFERFLVGGSPALFLDPALLGQRVALPGLPAGTLAGERVRLGRIGLPAGPLRPFVLAVTTDAADGWHRLVGAEQRWTLPPISLVPTPGLDLVVGVSRSLDEPFKGRTRGYFSAAVRP